MSSIYIRVRQGDEKNGFFAGGSDSEDPLIAGTTLIQSLVNAARKERNSKGLGDKPRERAAGEVGVRNPRATDSRVTTRSEKHDQAQTSRFCALPDKYFTET